jgi:hypothetical protein
MCKQRGFRASHPHLPTALMQPVKQCRAPFGVEMGGEFIEQQLRSLPPSLRDQIPMRQYKR